MKAGGDVRREAGGRLEREGGPGGKGKSRTGERDVTQDERFCD